LRITRRTLLASTAGALGLAQTGIPDRLVVLTFDDGPVSHATFVAPLLKKYDFGATFFICEFPPNFADKSMYMSWEQMASLHEMGFEVGNHTIAHKGVARSTRAEFDQALADLEKKAYALGIPKMVSFAYPSYTYNDMAIEVLKAHGYKYARTGLDRNYDPKTDSPYVIPGFTANSENRPAILKALDEAKDGHITVLTFHGVPDKEHPWVTLAPEMFEDYLGVLKEKRFTAIALRDLEKYLGTA